MKKNLFLAISLLMFVLSPFSSYALIYEFQPVPANMGHLNHSFYYSWSIDWDLPENEEIQSAELLIDGIFDGGDPDNILYIHLLDTPPVLNLQVSPNVTYDFDDDFDDPFYTDAWDGSGLLLGTWHDPFSDPLLASDLTFAFNDTEINALTTFIMNDGNYGFGFDPDCGFDLEEVTFRVETVSVPEPSTFIMLGASFLGIGIFARLKRK